MRATGRLRIRLEEMMQHMQKRADMLAVSPALRLTYIVYDMSRIASAPFGRQSKYCA